MSLHNSGGLLSLVSDLIPVYVHRYRWIESEHPRHAAGRPEGGEFRPRSASTSVGGATFPSHSAAEAASPGGQFRSTRRREIAALPDTIKRGHALHLSTLDQNTKVNLQNWHSRLSSHLARVEQGATDQEKEYAWSQVNKDAIRLLLKEMNDMDRQFGHRNGNRLSDWVNANGLIPQFLAERLDSGRRFFDPERIRDKISEHNRGTPIFSDAEEAGYKAYQQADRWEQKRLLTNPEIRSVVERKMGLNPSSSPAAEQEISEDPINQPSNSVQIPGNSVIEGNAATKAEQQKFKKKLDINPQLMARVKSAVESYIGDDNPEAQTALEKAVPEAWRTLKSEAEEWNEGLRGIFSGIRAKGQALGSMIQKVARADDPMSIVGFDEYVDFARKNFPHIVANKWGEEEGLMEAFRQGIRPIPKIDSREVIDRAVDMLGPSFRRMLEEAPADELSEQDQSLPVYDDGDPIPFSVRAWVNWLHHSKASRN